MTPEQIEDEKPTREHCTSPSEGWPPMPERFVCADCADRDLSALRAAVERVADHLHSLSEIPNHERHVSTISGAYLHAEEHVRALLSSGGEGSKETKP